jgi:hypothetical protein
MNREATSLHHHNTVKFNQQPYVTDRMAKLMFVLATLAFLGVQSMALLIFVKRLELHFDHQLLLYVITFGAPLPWLIGIQGCRHIKRQFAATGGNQSLLQTVLYFVMFVIGAAYLQLLFCLAFVVAGLHLQV